jgi:hypothetical protein
MEPFLTGLRCISRVRRLRRGSRCRSRILGIFSVRDVTEKQASLSATNYTPGKPLIGRGGIAMQLGARYHTRKGYHICRIAAASLDAVITFDPPPSI